MYGFQGTTSAISFLGRLFQEKEKKKTISDNEVECFVVL